MPSNELKNPLKASFFEYKNNWNYPFSIVKKGFVIPRLTRYRP